MLSVVSGQFSRNVSFYLSDITYTFHNYLFHYYYFQLPTYSFCFLAFETCIFYQLQMSNESLMIKQRTLKLLEYLLSLFDSFAIGACLIFKF